MVGGDFNMAPEAVAEGVAKLTGGRVLVPPNGRATCTAGSTHSQMDMVVAYGGLQNAAVNTDAVHGTCVKTHRPVVVEFEKKITSLRLRQLQKPI